jgi:hypothetical protein
MLETIQHDEKCLALIVRRQFNEDGIHFFTPNEFSQQLAFMKHPKDKVIQPHVHNPIPREVFYTQEVLVIRKGKLRVDFYGDNKVYLFSKVLVSGDIIMLVSGGHGFLVIEPVEMFEIKQGPFAGDADKTRFEPTSENLVVIRDVQDTESA